MVLVIGYLLMTANIVAGFVGLFTSDYWMVVFSMCVAAFLYIETRSLHVVCRQEWKVDKKEMQGSSK